MTYTAAMPKQEPKAARLASRITRECRDLLDAVMRRYGISEAAVIEMAVREYAEARGITAPKNPATYPAGSLPADRVNETTGDG